TVTVGFGGHGAHGVGFLRRRDGGRSGCPAAREAVTTSGGGSGCAPSAGGRHGGYAGPGSPGRSPHRCAARAPILACPPADAAQPAVPARRVGRSALRVFTVMAKPRPTLPASEDEPAAEYIAELMPMTAPFMSISAPPELPGLREASVWMAW